MSSDAIGVLQYNVCSCCPGGDTFTPGCCPCEVGCCKAIGPPSGPEWDAVIANAEWPRIKAEAEKLAKANGGCCTDVFKIKRVLDEQWLAEANTFLGAKGLKVEVLAFYTSDGKSSTPHLWLQFKKTANGL